IEHATVVAEGRADQLAIAGSPRRPYQSLEQRVAEAPPLPRVGHDDGELRDLRLAGLGETRHAEDLDLARRFDAVARTGRRVAAEDRQRDAARPVRLQQGRELLVADALDHTHQALVQRLRRQALDEGALVRGVGGPQRPNAEREAIASDEALGQTVGDRPACAGIGQAHGAALGGCPRQNSSTISATACTATHTSIACRNASAPCSPPPPNASTVTPNSHCARNIPPIASRLYAEKARPVSRSGNDRLTCVCASVCTVATAASASDSTHAQLPCAKAIASSSASISAVPIATSRNVVQPRRTSPGTDQPSAR